MLEPSKPKPSSNVSADSSVAGIEKCCHSPGTSINFKSTISALFFFAISKASLADMLAFSFCVTIKIENLILLSHSLAESYPPRRFQLFIGPLVVLAQVQAHPFLIVGDPQTHNRFHDGQENNRSDHGENPGCHDRHELNPQLTGITEEQTIVAGGVDRFRGEKTGCKGAPGSANAVDPHDVERIIVTQSWLPAASDRAKHSAADADPDC